ncbi:PRC-barrel domain-containing protein [Tabrizicola aquatica]|uniref:PRC-barrel domain-containing protein n=1 Tax=Tabrizicola aquatica TaxID=909926 RepID=UPI000CD07043|nr:PRC-barrel domain-containing protein [Tabrizicola aquatica]
MKRLILTTALVAAFLPSATLAQTADPSVTTPEMTVPEGFQRQDMMLSADDLIGQTVYDVTGEAIGDVNDLVFSMEEGTAATGSTGMDEAVATPDTSAAAGSGATGTDATTSGTTESAGDTSGAAAGDGVTTSEEAATDNDGAAATGDTATAPTVGEGDVGLGNATTGGTATGEAAVGDSAAEGTDATAADGSMSSGTDGTAATDGAAATDDAVSTDGTMPAEGSNATATGEAAASGQAETIGEVSHVVLDIGGFLGIGAHSVAVPVSDLAIYRSDSDTRIYLPWTREQLEAVPAYNEGDPSTYGTSTLPPTGNN